MEWTDYALSLARLAGRAADRGDFIRAARLFMQADQAAKDSLTGPVWQSRNRCRRTLEPGGSTHTDPTS